MLGEGSFGRVYQCRHIVDGWDYAVKISKKPLRGTKDLDGKLQEVFALAALPGHPNLVRFELVLLLFSFCHCFCFLFFGIVLNSFYLFYFSTDTTILGFTIPSFTSKPNFVMVETSLVKSKKDNALSPKRSFVICFYNLLLALIVFTLTRWFIRILSLRIFTSVLGLLARFFFFFFFFFFFSSLLFFFFPIPFSLSHALLPNLGKQKMV